VKEAKMDLEDDSPITEIDILPDGRVCLFGASQQVLEILDGIPLGDPALRSRIDGLRAARAQPVVEPNEACSVRNDETMKDRVRP
jgi:hypothetical protein